MYTPRSLFSKFAAPKSSGSGRLALGGRKTKQKKEEKHIKSSKINKIKYGDNRLVVIRHPDKRAINYLKKYYLIHPLHLDDISSTLQRPKLDLEDHYIFFVLHIPQFDTKSRRIITKEVDCFLTDSDVILIPDEGIGPLEELLKNLSKKRNLRKEYFEKGSGFLLYSIADDLVDCIFPLLEQVEKGVDQIDRSLFSEETVDIVEQISFLRRNLIFFQTLIKPELNYFTLLEEEEHYLLDEEIKIYFSNISDHFKKIWDRLEDARELIDNLSTTFESYFSFKTNETIKVLTIFSVILMPLTLLSGIYGMNLSYLPLAAHPEAIVFITIFMIFIIIAMIAVFRIKKWI